MSKVGYFERFEKKPIFHLHLFQYENVWRFEVTMNNEHGSALMQVVHASCNLDCPVNTSGGIFRLPTIRLKAPPLANSITRQRFGSSRQTPRRLTTSRTPFRLAPTSCLPLQAPRWAVRFPNPLATGSDIHGSWGT